MEPSVAVNEALFIEETKVGSKVVLRCSGKSVLTDPATVWTPPLSRAIQASLRTQRPFIIDLRHLTYANAETYSPIVPALITAADQDVRVTIAYDLSSPWQRYAVQNMASIGE